MKKLIIVLLAAIFVLAMVNVALAADPTGLKPDGKPFWSFKDRVDTANKNEGGYAPFSDSDSANPYATGTKYLSSPHGGYDTASNKCKVCHAVHRAEGAYFMLRADTQDDACDYCHIGGSAYSNKVVYDLNPNGKSTPNGHTIGAGSTIPDSSVYQYTEPVTLTTTDADGNTTTETVEVRRYDATRNKMFRFARHHGQGAAGAGRNGFMRIGPLALRCMNCHQPHNAKNMIWRPTDLETGVQLANGYKLLRSMPSASIWGTATIVDSGVTYTVNYDEGMKNHEAYAEYNPAAGEFYVNAANAIKVPETTLTASNTGRGFTIYTKYEGVTEPAHQHGPDRDPQTVNQYALSPWCADCHNLNIGYWKHLTNEELGYKSHADRTHPAPYTGAYNGPAQCYSCHRNDLPRVPSTSFYSPSRASCEECHFGTGSYKVVNDNVDGNGTASDFPHSGQSNSIKLLGPYTNYMDANGVRQQGPDGISESNIDGVCLRCHTGIGTNH